MENKGVQSVPRQEEKAAKICAFLNTHHKHGNWGYITHGKELFIGIEYNLNYRNYLPNGMIGKTRHAVGNYFTADAMAKGLVDEKFWKEMIDTKDEKIIDLHHTSRCVISVIKNPAHIEELYSLASGEKSEKDNLAKLKPAEKIIYNVLKTAKEITNEDKLEYRRDDNKFPIGGSARLVQFTGTSRTDRILNKGEYSQVKKAVEEFFKQKDVKADLHHESIKEEKKEIGFAIAVAKTSIDQAVEKSRPQMRKIGSGKLEMDLPDGRSLAKAIPATKWHIGPQASTGAKTRRASIGLRGEEQSAVRQ